MYIYFEGFFQSKSPTKNGEKKILKTFSKKMVDQPASSHSDTPALPLCAQKQQAHFPVGYFAYDKQTRLNAHALFLCS